MAERETDTRIILDALKESALVTKDFHRQNENRLGAIESEQRRQGEILQQYLVKKESWEQVQAEFSGQNSLHVQIAALRYEISTSKHQMQEIQNKCEEDMERVEERREQQDALEERRQAQHKSNVTKLWVAMIAGISGLLMAVIELFKK